MLLSTEITERVIGVGGPRQERDSPCGEGGVIRIAQQLMGVADGHQPVSQQLEAQTLVLWRLVDYRQTGGVSARGS